MDEMDIEQYEVELALRENGRTKAIEKAGKAEVERAKLYREARFVGMSELAMDALEMGLQSEDEGVRMKALAMYLDRTVSRVGIDRSGEEVIEVVNPATKMVADEIEKLIAKQIEEARNAKGEG